MDVHVHFFVDSQHHNNYKMCLFKLIYLNSFEQFVLNYWSAIWWWLMNECDDDHWNITINKMHNFLCSVKIISSFLSVYSEMAIYDVLYSLCVKLSYIICKLMERSDS